MIDAEREDLIRLAEVPSVWLELTGETVNFKSVYRWVKFGRRKIRLEIVPGIRKRTSRQAVARFLARQSALDNQPPPVDVTRGRRRELERANRTLAAAGR